MYPLMYNHNVDFQAVAAAMAGRYAEARKAAVEIAANVSPAVKDVPMIEFAVPLPALVDLRFAKWAEARQAPLPAEEFHLARVETRFVRAIGALMSGDLAAAASERDAYETAARAVNPDIPLGAAE